MYMHQWWRSVISLGGPARQLRGVARNVILAENIWGADEQVVENIKWGVDCGILPGNFSRNFLRNFCFEMVNSGACWTTFCTF